MDRRALLTVALALAAMPAGATDRLAPFRRGVSIHNLMNWGRVDPADKARYLWPPFDSPAHKLKPAILDNVKKAGFDFIRLTIDPGVFLATDGARRDDLDLQLMAHVKALMARGLGVIVDFHPNSQVAAYAPEKITGEATSPLFTAYTAMVARTAKLLAPLSKQRVALELMNEPQWGWDGATAKRWEDQQKTLHDAARAASPDLKLVLTGARGGDIDGLTNVDPAPYKASNVLWSFHYYEPFLLTHQGVKGDNGDARLWRYFSELPYPAAPEFFDPAFKLARAAIDADAALSAPEKRRITAEAERALKAYLAQEPGRARIAKDFAKLDAWAKKHGVPADRLFMGEFGVTRTYGPYKASPPGPLENWLADVRSEAEARGVGWALWALSGYGGMSLIETDDATTLDKPTLKGLGLTPP